jgi:glycosyltransferase involved in cell wall biosynthesis
MRKSICILSYSDIASDARVLRQVKYLSPVYDLIVIGYGRTPQDFSENDRVRWIEISRGKKTAFRRLSDLRRIIRYVLGVVDRPDVLQKAIESKCDAYHANNWDSLPIAAIAATCNKSVLFLDIHESLSTANGTLYNWLNHRIVKKYAKRIDASSTVVQVIADSYQQNFGFLPFVLRNIPSFDPQAQLDKSIDPEKIRLIHHGVAGPARRSDLMIRTIALCDERYELHLVFTNITSKYVSGLKKLAEQIAQGRVFFHSAYPSLKIVENISKFDIGFFPLPPTNFNYHIALPNKFFEFIAAGLAVCIGPSPSMAEIVEQYHCGVVAKSFDPQDLADLINQTSISDWQRMQKASREAARVLNADVEMNKLLDIYETLLEEKQ